METWSRVFVLSAGGALGVNARYWLGLAIARRAGPRFPWSTVAINASGSFAIGLGAVVLAHRWPDPLARLFVLTGFLGGYTTFSAFAFESLALWERGDRGLSVANSAGSVLAGLAAVTLGVAAGRAIVGPAAEADRLAHHRGRVAGPADAAEFPPSPGGVDQGRESAPDLDG